MVRELDGDREARLKAHVETRGWTCEQWLPLWRALNANQGDSEELKARILLVRQAVLKRIELMYRAELSTLAERERQQILIAIETLIDFESWARMREYKGLSFAEACQVWIHAIDRSPSSMPATIIESGSFIVTNTSRPPRSMPSSPRCASPSASRPWSVS